MRFIGRRFISMRVKFVVTAIITGVSVILGALIAIPLTLLIFRDAYMQTDRVEARMEAYISSFASYVAEGDLSSDDTASVVRWTRSHRAVYLTILNEDDTAPIPSFGAAGGELWQGGDEPDRKPFFDPILSPDSSLGFTADETSRIYAVGFSNGVHSVAVVDYSMSMATDIIIVCGVLLAIAVFLLVMLIYYHLQIRAIVILSEKVEAVSGGQLDAEITASRNDEIGQLASDVNLMRETILKKMAEKEAAWQANSDLLTSMTHDIRTPLTTLLGYMDLLERDNRNLTREQQEYVRICTQKAEQIKGLSDKLFLYFWAYNQADSDSAPALESYECGLLMEQLIGDYIPSMEAAGLTILADLSSIQPSDTVKIQIEYLRRVTDNLFDNITKYADPRHPVRITAQREGNCLRLHFTNTVGRRREHTTSTRIGVKTCINMMEQLNGRFETREEGKLFTATLVLPVAE